MLEVHFPQTQKLQAAFPQGLGPWLWLSCQRWPVAGHRASARHWWRAQASWGGGSRGTARRVQRRATPGSFWSTPFTFLLRNRAPEKTLSSPGHAGSPGHPARCSSSTIHLRPGLFLGSSERSVQPGVGIQPGVLASASGWYLFKEMKKVKLLSEESIWGLSSLWGLRN